MSFTVSVDVDRVNLELDVIFGKQVIDIAREEGESLVEFLERNSPQGVSPDSRALKTNWNILVDNDVADDELLTLSNDSPDALDKLRGRPPGGRPDASPGSDLDRWVRGILGITDPAQRRLAAERIALSIQRMGTERFRTGDNILGVDPRTGAIGQDSPLFDSARRIELRIGAINIEA